MYIEIPFDQRILPVKIEDHRVAGIITGNDVPTGDENAIINKSINQPIDSNNLVDFLKDAKDALFIVNDATRPTPTSRVLENLFQIIKPVNPKFIVATGTHPAPTEKEYIQIFGRFYEEYKSNIYAHDARADKDMVYLGTSRNGTEFSVNKLMMKASRIIIISSVEPHYFAGYTGGRKSIIPGIASYKSVEQNHFLALQPEARSLALDTNPVHEDMMDVFNYLTDKEIFAIMMVLDKNHRIFAATSGNIKSSFHAAVQEANKVFAVKIKEKADIVVTVARFPMDINLYQSQKALDNGKLALKKGGIMIMVSACRMGTGDDSFIKLFRRCNTPAQVLENIRQNFKLGYHKAAKMAEINLWAEIYAVTSLPDDILAGVFFTPFRSLQEALEDAINKKGKDAKVLFLLDGGMTVPIIE